MALLHHFKLNKTNNITREQFALFLDCNPTQELILPNYALSYDETVSVPFLPKSVPKLKDRLKNCKIYRDFVVNTLNSYYN